MKVHWNEKYKTISIYSFLVIASSIIFFLVLSKLDTLVLTLGKYISFLQPFIYGFIIAYLINFIYTFLERNIIKIKTFKNKSSGITKSISLALSYTIGILFFYLFFTFILPQLIESISGLVRSIPSYIDSANMYLNTISENLELPKEVLTFIDTRWQEMIKKINSLSKDIVPGVINFLMSTVMSIWNLVLGIIISIYMLLDKERFISSSKKIAYSIFSVEKADRIMILSRRAKTIFKSFLGGKLLDSFIIGLLAFVVFTLTKMPYSVLITFIIAITNIIPFFGPFIGAVPSVIIIFFESPIKAFWFLAIILIIQQIDGNIIGPKILGDSLGVSSFWILFAILLGGKFFGFIGLVIGVPLFVFLQSLLDDFLEKKLTKKNLSLNTDTYFDK